MAKQATARAVDLEPIDRLEEKITLLVSMISRLRAEQAKAQEDNAALAHEINRLRSRVADADGSQTELVTMREERDVIRARISEMLQQLEQLSV